MRAVITFHALADSDDVLSFPPRLFAQWIETLLRGGIPIVPFAELQRRSTGVTLTFDDGMRSVHEHALPVLKHHGLTAHLFLATGAVGRDNRWASQPAESPTFPMLDWSEVCACADGGLLIESHTRSHPDLRTLGTDAVVEECRTADNDIERHVGRRPRLFAYPYGRFDRRVAAAVTDRYDACFTTRLEFLGRADDRSAVPRIDAYYLRRGWVAGHFASPLGRAYMTARGLARRLRGS